MDVIVPTDAKFFVDKEGTVYPTQRVHTADFWHRYHPVFQRVIFSGRQVRQDGCRAQSPAVSKTVRFLGLPSFFNPLGLLVAVWRLWHTLAAHPNAAICLRMPSFSSSIVGLYCIRHGRPFGVEVVGDPATALVSSGSGIALIDIAQRFLVWSQKRICFHAAGTAYVTQAALQLTYSPNPLRFTTHYSTISLVHANFRARQSTATRGPSLINVGSMGKVLYKGQDLLLRVIATLATEYPGIRLTLVGDGSRRRELENYAKSLGVESRVTFTGHLQDHRQIEAALDAADIFVFPSRTEGLPKALIEAMARGLPAVATNAGGISELLSDSMVCAVDDAAAIANRLRMLFECSELRAVESAKNFTKAHEFHLDVLEKRRDRYYEEVRLATEHYIARKS